MQKKIQSGREDHQIDIKEHKGYYGYFLIAVSVLILYIFSISSFLKLKTGQIILWKAYLDLAKKIKRGKSRPKPYENYITYIDA